MEAEVSELRDLEQNIEKLRLEGNTKFKDGLYKEAADAYSAAIDMSRGTTAFNALLLTNRASVYIKRNQLDDALKDANEYISRFPHCWKGYARKALALDDKVSAEIAAALAYYYFSLKDGRSIFSEYAPFIGAFPGLKERISICHTVDQLMEALVSFSSQDCLRVIILGSKEYKLPNFSPCVGMTNCIMVGAKPDPSVTIELGNIVMSLLEKCMLANLSFAIDKKGQIEACDNSWVKVLNCNFTSNHDVSAAVGSTGVFNAERCNFTHCKAGGLLCVGPGNMVVDNCTFAGNVKAGLEVRENGILTVRNSRMYNNATQGLTIGPRTAKCDAFDCQIYNNAQEGIAALDESKRITLIRNEIFGNDCYGIYARNSEIDMRENKVFGNEAWGIWSQTNTLCKVSMNEVFRNKRGGIRVGKRRTGRKFPPSVVELNTVHDNFGPGIVDTINIFDGFLGNDCQSAKKNGNVEYNNEETIIVNKSKFSSSWCSGCNSKRNDLKLCGKCFTAGYCNRDCQNKHWSKHKKLCKVLRKKSSVLISSMKKNLSDGKVNIHAEGLDKVGPNYSLAPPPRNGKRFVVKLENNFERGVFGEPYVLFIYDRSLDVYDEFQDKFIDHLVTEFGAVCEKKYQEKKIFLHCLFEDDGKLRLFINDFADYQRW